MTSIYDLADCIVLDDVTDVFYRTLCFSNFIRSMHDPKSEIETQLDKALSQRLVRQLNWTSSICSLDVSTHKFSHILSMLAQEKLTQESLLSELDDNYWLDTAIKKISAESDNQAGLLQAMNDSQINQTLSSVGWTYFSLLLSPLNQGLLEQIKSYSNSIAKAACEKGDSDVISQDSYHHLSFLNAFPAIVLLMLFDKSVQSVKQEMLNNIAYECDSQREQVKAYQPCAETLLSFLIFDEFLKPHIFESINFDQMPSSINKDDSQLSEQMKIFLLARNDVIVDSLSGIPVLTAKQVAEFKGQVGVNISLETENKTELKNQKLWQKLFIKHSEPTLCF